MTPVYGSLFSGVGGFDLGFEAAGWRCAWQVEIDPVCQAVLRRHWPDVPKFLDVRDCGAVNLAPVDCIVGGFPCQDISIAGNQAGLLGDRSALFFEIPRIVREMREATDGRCPTWLVLENVPRILSIGHGRDFARVLAELQHCGALDICWRVLDAQHWGVAQRRRRVFVVADFRGERAGEVLFESASVRGDSQASGAQREGVAGTLGGGAGQPRWPADTDRMTFVAHTLTAADPNAPPKHGKRQDGSRYDRDSIVAESLARTVTANYGKQVDSSDTSVGPPNLVVESLALRGREGGATAELGGAQAAALRGAQGGGDKAHVLVSGAVSSKWAKGTGGPAGDEVVRLIAAPLTASYGHHGCSSPRGDGSEPLVTAFDWTAGHGNDTSFRGKSRIDPVRKGAYAGSVQSGKQDAVLIQAAALEPLHIRCGCGRVYHGELDTVCPYCGLMQGGAVTYPPSRGGMTRQEKIDYANGILPAAWDGVGITSKTNRSSVVPGAPAPTLNGSGLASLASPAAVRRLTPTECERLQGWPDGHSRFRDDGTEIADGPRYRMIGNGVVAPLARWLAERLAAAAEGYPPERCVTTPNVPPPRPAERSQGIQTSAPNVPNAAAPDHPSRFEPDLYRTSADRGTPMPSRRAEMPEKPHRSPDRSSASPLAIAPSDLALSASDERNADG